MNVDNHKMIDIISKKLNRHLVSYYPRNADKFVLDRFKDKEINVIEVGVWKGFHAEFLLKYLNIKRLYLVDPYENYLEEKLQMYKRLSSAR